MTPLPSDIHRLARRRAVQLRQEAIDDAARRLKRWLARPFQRLQPKEQACHS